MAVRRELQSLLGSERQGRGRHRLRSPWLRRRKLASFVYVAEQYGYRYDGLASPPGTTPVLEFRRLPDAAERAARTHEHFPDAQRGGQLPGMRPGLRRLVPLAATQREVDLLFAPFVQDVTEESYARKGARSGTVSGVVVMVVFAVAGVFYADSVGDYLTTTGVIDGILGLVVITAYFWGRAARRRARDRSGRLLARAGAERPPPRACP